MRLFYFIYHNKIKWGVIGTILRLLNERHHFLAKYLSDEILEQYGLLRINYPVHQQLPMVKFGEEKVEIKICHSGCDEEHQDYDDEYPSYALDDVSSDKGVSYVLNGCFEDLSDHGCYFLYIKIIGKIRYTEMNFLGPYDILVDRLSLMYEKNSDLPADLLTQIYDNAGVIKGRYQIYKIGTLPKQISDVTISLTSPQWFLANLKQFTSI